MTALLEGLRWRLIGPFRGGRSVAVAGHPEERLIFYFGSTGGGVWKTEDAGRTWANVSDGYFGRASVGAIAVSQSDPNVVYVGMGEACLRNTVSHGDGVYRSDDGGRSWRHLGLAATRHIGRVRVDPRDPDVVYVAALGHAHGPNSERGVYRSRDGGRSWELVLHRGEHAGAVDLCIDGHAPRRLFATTWEVRRRPWRLDSGGEGSGLWRSEDGGDTWTDLSRKPGMAKGVLGRIGVTLSPAKEGRVWAIVEAEEGGVYRSDDFGEHWVRGSQQWQLRGRPFYYSHVFADPLDAETVWVLETNAWRSIDGGSSFSNVAVQHGDCHDLWIDPQDTRRLILGDDGGASISFDGAATWSSLLNQPTAELYHVTTDTRQPYRVYASQQDNSSLSLATQSDTGTITVRDMYTVGGGESGYIAVRPDNPDIVFAADYNGEVTRYDHGARKAEPIWVWPDYLRGGGAKTERYRFNWTTPLLVSPHDPSVLYQAGNVIFVSRDEGRTWDPISPDLTRNDPDKLGTSGGPLTQENGGAEYWCTVFAIAESPVQPGLLWAGSDDGLVHVSDDSGRSWRNVTPSGVPEWSTISVIEASPHDAATAYIAVDNHRNDDFHPYLLRTSDRGATWKRIDAGIPDDEFCRVIREDPAQRGLLVAGTEAGIYVSHDDGQSWHACRGNLPVVPVHDLAFKGDELIVATHGRAIWILDELPALRAHRPAAADPMTLYPPHRLVRWNGRGGPHGAGKAGSGTSRDLHWAFGLTAHVVERRAVPDRDESETRLLDAGENPPPGAVVLYELPEPGDQEFTLTILDAAGAEVRRFTTTLADEAPKKPEDKPKQPEEPHPPRRAGLNRFEWDGAIKPGTKIEVDAADGDLMGDYAPPVLPGTYEIRLRLGEQERSTSVEIGLDPRVQVSRETMEERRRALLAAYSRWGQLNETVNRLRRLKQRLGRWIPGEGEPAPAEGSQAAGFAARATEIRDAITQIEDELTAADVKGWPLIRVLLSRPARLDMRLARIVHMLGSGWGEAPQSTRQVLDELLNGIDAAEQRLRALLDGPVAAFERELREAGVPVLDATGG